MPLDRNLLEKGVLRMPNRNEFFDIPVSGSLAYDFTAQPEFPREREWGWPVEDERKVIIPAAPRVEERTARRPMVRSRQSVSPAAIIGFACAAVLLIFTLMAKIQLTAITDQSVALESTLAELKIEQARLQIEYESAFNLTEIEEYATRELGMQRPREEQIFYLQGSAPDKAVVIENTQEEKGFFDRLYEMLDFIGEYFR